MEMKLRHYMLLPFLAFVAVMLQACGSAGGLNDPEVSYKIMLSTDDPSVYTGNLNASDIEITVLNANNNVVSDVELRASTDRGVLYGLIGGTETDDEASQSREETDLGELMTNSVGKAYIRLRSGTVQENTDVRVKVAALNEDGLVVGEGEITVKFVGTNMTLDIDRATLLAGGEDTSPISVQIIDATGKPITGTTVSFSVENGVLEENAVLTDATGVAKTVLVSSDLIGSGQVTAQAAGASASSSFEITNTKFVFESPVQPAVQVNDPIEVSVIVTNSSGTNVVGEEVRFYTNIGTFSNGSSVMSAITEDDGHASVSFSVTESGPVKMEARDSTGSLRSSLSLYASASEAAGITMSVSPTQVHTGNSALLEAMVRDAFGNVVENQLVTFSIVEGTGSGDRLTPVVATTNDQGVAQATFVAGDNLRHSAQVRAALASNPSIADDATLNVTGDSAVYISLSVSRIFEPGETGRDYYKFIDIDVSDINGNPVAGQEVDISVWPTKFKTGYWFATTTDGIASDGCAYTVTGTFDNEDLNRNGVLDPGEDGFTGYFPNGLLDPGGGITIRSSNSNDPVGKVITDDQGRATAQVDYRSDKAPWVHVEVSAKTRVQGSEGSATREFQLGVSSEANAPNCVNPWAVDSPWGATGYSNIGDE